MRSEHEQFIRLAMSEAEQAVNDGNRPFGAVIVDPAGNVAVREHNRVVEQLDPTAHAEMTAIRSLCRAWRTLALDGCRIYTNAQPCPMCFAAMVEVKIADLYFAAPPAPGVWPSISITDLAERFERHRIRVHGGILAREAEGQLRRLNTLRTS